MRGSVPPLRHTFFFAYYLIVHGDNFTFMGLFFVLSSTGINETKFLTIFDVHWELFFCPSELLYVPPGT
jgi:hypothetical protein